MPLEDGQESLDSNVGRFGGLNVVPLGLEVSGKAGESCRDLRFHGCVGRRGAHDHIHFSWRWLLGLHEQGVGGGGVLPSSGEDVEDRRAVVDGMCHRSGDGEFEGLEPLVGVRQ